MRRRRGGFLEVPRPVLGFLAVILFSHCIVVAVAESANVSASETLNVGNLATEFEAYRQEWLEKSESNSSGQPALLVDAILRFSGEDVVPFNLPRQRIFIETGRDIVIPSLGPMEVINFREGYPDPEAPEEVDTPLGTPHLDVYARAWSTVGNFAIPGEVVTNAKAIDGLDNSSVAISSFDESWSEEYAVLLRWSLEMGRRGFPGRVRFMTVTFARGMLTEPTLTYSIPFEFIVAIKLIQRDLNETTSSIDDVESQGPRRRLHCSDEFSGLCHGEKSEDSLSRFKRSNKRIYRRSLLDSIGTTESELAAGLGPESFEKIVSLVPSQASRVEDFLSENLKGWAAGSVSVVSFDSEVIQQELSDPISSYSVVNGSVLKDGTRSAESLALLKLEVLARPCEATVKAVQALDPNSLGASPSLGAVESYQCEKTEIRSAIEYALKLQDSTRESISFVEQAEVVAFRDRPILGQQFATSTSKQSKEQTSRDEESSSDASFERTWVPKHLDALDQRALPLDGKYSATADGTGVNVYLISSGVRFDHQEFGYYDGSPGSRVYGSWGFNGTDPLQDCPDGPAWYYFGTYAASIIAGKTIGVARNATINSVRMRENCLLQNPYGTIWSPGGLPSALDSVLSTFKRPGVVVVDTWWSPSRLSLDDDEYIEKALLERLENAGEREIPIIVPGDMAFGLSSPCENIFTRASSVINVGAVTWNRHQGYFGSSANNTCVDVYASTGILGEFMIGADARDVDTYRSVCSHAFGASWIVAGIAAQHLQLNPNYTAAELKSAIIGNATRDAIVGLNDQGSNLLAFTNLEVVSSSTGNGDISSSVVIAVAVVVPIVVIALLLALYLAKTSGWLWIRRKPVPVGLNSASEDDFGSDGSNGAATDKYLKGSVDAGFADKCDGGGGSKAEYLNDAVSELKINDWEILPSQISILKRADGSPWLLGAGRWGTVHRGLKDGIQQVAVKTLMLSCGKKRSEMCSGPLDNAMENDVGQISPWSLSGESMESHRVQRTNGHSFDQAVFAREIAMMRWLSRDANVVQFFGAVVQGDDLMLVTELMDGGDLRYALTEDTTGKFRWYELGKSIALDIARGLHFLHTHDVVHRDIKSKNILLTRDLRAKIADVGVAHVISNDPDSQLMLGNQHSAPRSPSSSSDDARHSIVTGTDIAVDSINSNAGFVGTFSWAAPELLLGGKVTTKTDMYSFGVVLFEIVTGEVPVRGHIHLPDAPACCPQEVVDLMSACMSIQPEGRPTAKEAYGILERCPPHDT